MLLRESSAMNSKPVRIQVIAEGNVLVVAPVGLIGELEYEECEADFDLVVKRCESPDVQSVVLDLGGVELFGSSAVGWFLEMSHHIAGRSGRMVLCHVSDVGKSVLRASKLVDHWPIYANRDEGLAAVRQRAESKRS
jgi:anti-anti-sigma factor